MMLPNLIDIAGVPWPVLPEGIHISDFAAVGAVFASNPPRKSLFGGLLAASQNLLGAGCQRIYLDGSFVTGKPIPGDYDVCWDPRGVNRKLLDPAFLVFDHQRKVQKEKFKGEFFPSSARADNVGRTFLDFFQIEKSTGCKKGIVQIELTNDSMLPVRDSP